MRRLALSPLRGLRALTVGWGGAVWQVAAGNGSQTLGLAEDRVWDPSWHTVGAGGRAGWP